MPASTRASRTPHRSPVAGQGERAPVPSERRPVLHAPARTIPGLGQGVGGPVGELPRRRARGRALPSAACSRCSAAQDRWPSADQAIGDRHVQIAALTLRQARVGHVAERLVAEPPPGDPVVDAHHELGFLELREVASIAARPTPTRRPGRGRTRTRRRTSAGPRRGRAPAARRCASRHHGLHGRRHRGRVAVRPRAAASRWSPR